MENQNLPEEVVEEIKRINEKIHNVGKRIAQGSRV